MEDSESLLRNYCLVSISVGYMGKTNLTYRDTIRQFENDWKPYRKALRTQHVDDFDRLIDRARNFADAGGIQNHPHPTTTHMISILLSQEVHMQKMEERLEEIENRH